MLLSISLLLAVMRSMLGERLSQQVSVCVGLVCCLRLVRWTSLQWGDQCRQGNPANSDGAAESAGRVWCCGQGGLGWGRAAASTAVLITLVKARAAAAAVRHSCFCLRCLVDHRHMHGWDVAQPDW